MKITIKAIWLAVLAGDFVSVWKLFNIKKNNEFIKALEDIDFTKLKEK